MSDREPHESPRGLGRASVIGPVLEPLVTSSILDQVTGLVPVDHCQHCGGSMPGRPGIVYAFDPGGLTEQLALSSMAIGRCYRCGWAWSSTLADDVDEVGYWVRAQADLQERAWATLESRRARERHARLETLLGG